MSLKFGQVLPARTAHGRGTSDTSDTPRRRRRRRSRRRGRRIVRRRSSNT